MISPNCLPDTGNSSGVERQLQERVARARDRYEWAIAEVARLRAESRDANANVPSRLEQALRLRHAATRRYSDALRELADFVLGYRTTNCA